jgi:hypothetical protein
MKILDIACRDSLNFAKECCHPAKQRDFLILGYNNPLYIFFDLPVNLYNCKLLQTKLILFKIPPFDFQHETDECMENRYNIYPLLNFFSIYDCCFSPPNIDDDRKIIFHNNKNSSYSEIDITRIVKTWLCNKIENKGLMLTGSKNSPNIIYASNSYKIPGMRPFVRISYEYLKICRALSCVPCDVSVNNGLESTGQNSE